MIKDARENAEIKELTRFIAQIEWGHYTGSCPYCLAPRGQLLNPTRHHRDCDLKKLLIKYQDFLHDSDS